jgi:hypothetical protein
MVLLNYKGETKYEEKQSTKGKDLSVFVAQTRWDFNLITTSSSFFISYRLSQTTTQFRDEYYSVFLNIITNVRAPIEWKISRKLLYFSEFENGILF